MDSFFFGDSATAPLSKKKADRAFKSAVHAIGIEEKIRLERGLSFHSWRHWFNTQMRRKVSDNQLRKVTRHRSSEMTDRYAHQLESDLKLIDTVQEEVFSSSIFGVCA